MSIGPVTKRSTKDAIPVITPASSDLSDCFVEISLKALRKERTKKA
jgi:hypothetical protein